MTILQKHLIFIPLGLICFGGLFGLVVMLLWNWLMPWFILFGLAKTCQYGGLTILGVEGAKRLKAKFKKS